MAQIGDSITVCLTGERIKVTLLGLIDPATVTDRLDEMFAELRDDSNSFHFAGGPASNSPADLRYVAVQLKLRNLDSPIAGKANIVHGLVSGTIVDTAGVEHHSGITGITGSSPAIAPQRGQPSVWVPRTQPRHLISAFASRRARYSPNSDKHDRSLWFFDSSI
jgi:hypothetical protein